MPYKSKAQRNAYHREYMRSKREGLTPPAVKPSEPQGEQIPTTTLTDEILMPPKPEIKEVPEAKGEQIPSTQIKDDEPPPPPEGKIEGDKEKFSSFILGEVIEKGIPVKINLSVKTLFYYRIASSGNNLNLGDFIDDCVDDVFKGRNLGAGLVKLKGG